jgi:hypothetical protein
MLLTEFHESVRRLLEQLRQWLPTNPELAAKQPFAYNGEKLRLYETILVAVHELQVKWSEASDDVKSREEWTLVDELLADVPLTTGEVSVKKRERRKANWQLITALGAANDTAGTTMQELREALQKFGARETKETREAQTWNEKNTAPLFAPAAECEKKLRFGGQMRLGGLLRLVQPKHRLQLCAMYVQTMKFARVIELTRSNYVNCDAAFVEGCAMLKAKNVSFSDLIRNPDQLRMLFPSMVGSDDWKQMVVRNAQKVGMDVLTGSLDILDLRDAQFRPLIEAARDPTTGKIDPGRIFANMGSLMLRMKPSPPKNTGATKSPPDASVSGGGGGGGTETKKSARENKGESKSKERKVETEEEGEDNDGDEDVGEGDAEGDFEGDDGEGDVEGDYELDDDDGEGDVYDGEGDAEGDEQQDGEEEEEEEKQEDDLDQEDDDGEDDAKVAVVEKKSVSNVHSSAPTAKSVHPLSNPLPATIVKPVSRNRTVPVPTSKSNVSRATLLSSSSSSSSAPIKTTSVKDKPTPPKKLGVPDLVKGGGGGAGGGGGGGVSETRVRSLPPSPSSTLSPPPPPSPEPSVIKRRAATIAPKHPSVPPTFTTTPTSVSSSSHVSHPSSFVPSPYQSYSPQSVPQPYYHQMPPSPSPHPFGTPTYMYQSVPSQNYYAPPPPPPLPQSHGSQVSQGMVLYMGPHGPYYAPATPNYGRPLPPSYGQHPPPQTLSGYAQPPPQTSSGYAQPPPQISSGYAQPPPQTSSGYAQPPLYGYGQTFTPPYGQPAIHHMQYPPSGTSDGIRDGTSTSEALYGTSGSYPHNTSASSGGTNEGVPHRLTPTHGGPPIESAISRIRMTPLTATNLKEGMRDVTTALTRIALSDDVTSTTTTATAVAGGVNRLVGKPKMPVSGKSSAHKPAVLTNVRPTSSASRIGIVAGKVAVPKSTVQKGVKKSVQSADTPPVRSAADMFQEMADKNDTAGMLDFYDQFSQMFPRGTPALQIQEMVGPGLVASGIPQRTVNAIFKAVVVKEKADHSQPVSTTPVTTATTTAPTATTTSDVAPTTPTVATSTLTIPTLPAPSTETTVPLPVD